jgi:hypothetical protein
LGGPIYVVAVLLALVSAPACLDLLGQCLEVAVVDREVLGAVGERALGLRGAAVPGDEPEAAEVQERHELGVDGLADQRAVGAEQRLVQGERVTDVGQDPTHSCRSAPSMLRGRRIAPGRAVRGRRIVPGRGGGPPRPSGQDAAGGLGRPVLAWRAAARGARRVAPGT